MSNHGRFIWHELMTTDPAAAPSFYGEVVGWTTQSFGEGMDYTMWVANGVPVGGFMMLPEGARSMGAPSHWMGYVSVADLDAKERAVVRLGGRVYVPPTAIPGGGRFAIFADPTGATFGMHENDGSDPIGKGPGHFGWAELATSDPEAAWAFYGELFGWHKTDFMDMGPMGLYELVGTEAPAQRGPVTAASMATSFGAILPRSPEMPVSAWTFYAEVADADQAQAKALALGAAPFMEVMTVPSGDRVGLFADPAGAAFGVVSSPKS